MSESDQNRHEATGESVPLRLDAERAQCAELFASGLMSIADLALKYHVSERTIRRWVNTPAARELVSDIRSASVSVVAGRLVDDLRAAIDRLNQLVDSANEMISLGAIRLKLEVTLKLRAFEEFDRRLAVVEERQKEGVAA